jgi:hypothetical protein
LLAHFDKESVAATLKMLPEYLNFDKLKELLEHIKDWIMGHG